MTRIATALLAAALLVSPTVGRARGGGHGGGSHSSGARSYSHSGSYSSGSHGNQSHRSSTSHRSTYSTTATRTSSGKIKRSSHAKSEFKKTHPCPSTGKSSGACPGYVIDHVTPLKRGGPDAPSNMQWQTTADAKAKDKWE
jgi:hypothetical protein